MDMEMSAVVGVLVALPQSIQSAKELYDLRAKYKDASVLITAIYSESMVIAASLSQVQNLLQHDALREKPQLLETFDRALTGCRVVYGCLEEEVRELRVKAENDDLKFKDRARFLWKEDTFRELLTQIRGQQSALSLLIQGLQMESIADIKKLVEDNSVTLDQVVKRSRTLRQSHPRLKVPESLFSRRSLGDEGVDTDSIAKATEFAFDDEVVNSKAYRRAMAMALSSPSNGATVPESSHTDVLEDYSTALGSISEGDDKNKSVDAIDLAPPSAEEEKTITSVLQPEAEPELSSQVAAKDDHADLFDTLERDILSFMPQTSSTALCLTPNHTGSKNPSPLPSQPTDPLTPNHTGSENIDTSALATHLTNSLTPAPLRSFSGDKATHDSEAPPPLPPRRPSRQPVATPEMRSVSPDDSIFSSDPPSILSKVSTASSHTVYEVAQWNPNSTGQQLSRKPLSLVHKSSHHALGNIEFDAHEPHAQGTSLLLHNIEMNSIWRSLVDTERKFVDRMIKLKRMFYDNIIKQWPIIEKHLNAILVGEQLASLHQQCLLHTMDQELAGNGSALCNPHVFEVWVDKSQRLYREYCRTMPHASSSLRTTQNMDPKFSPFVNTLGLSLAYYGKSWQDYLELPSIQLQTYIDSLESLITIAETLRDPAASSEVARLRRALQAVTWLKTLTLALLEEAQGREDVQNLEKRIRTDTNTLSQLHLHEPTRRVVRQGGMAMKIKSQGPWIPVHAVLLDNYFLWGRVKKSRGDEVLVTDPPVALADIGFFLPADAHQIQKATMLDQIARGSILYIVTLTNKAREGKPDLLGLYNIQDRKTWTDHFTTAWTKSRG